MVHAQCLNGHIWHLLRPLAQPSGDGQWPCVYWKQKQALSIELIGIVRPDADFHYHHLHLFV